MFEEEVTLFKENSMKIRFFPTVEGNSQSPVKTLLFPISPLLDDEDNFASRQSTQTRTGAKEGTERLLLVVQDLASGQYC